MEDLKAFVFIGLQDPPAPQWLTPSVLNFLCPSTFSINLKPAHPPNLPSGALLWAKILLAHFLVSFIAIYGYNSVRDVVLVVRLMDSESFIEISTIDTSSKNYH